MGRDKAHLPVGGRTLAELVAETVSAVAGPTAFVGGAPRDSDEFGFVSDLHPGEGPLGGILSALRHTNAGWNLIVACDMPALTVEFLHQLMDAAEPTNADALVPAGPDGAIEPLCAVYRRQALDGLQAAFDAGARKIATALKEIRCVTWPVKEVSYFQNLNTPEDWAEYGR
jgi:molybdenum cofactor guanylyltransferase